jgi:hypothetical protein
MKAKKIRQIVRKNNEQVKREIKNDAHDVVQRMKFITRLKLEVMHGMNIV